MIFLKDLIIFTNFKDLLIYFLLFSKDEKIMFEIKAKDMRGRVGVLKTKHGDVKTPNLMPVIHPRKQTINVKDYGADIVLRIMVQIL